MVIGVGGVEMKGQVGIALVQSRSTALLIFDGREGFDFSESDVFSLEFEDLDGGIVSSCW